jgi:uncharacterized protein (TIRG00374 family)
MWRRNLFRIIKITTPFIISSSILVLLLKKIDLQTWIASIYDTNLWAIAIPFLIYPFIKILNTLRYSTLFKLKNFLQVFATLSYCNLVLNIIPFRLGEYSYISQLYINFHIPKYQTLNRLILIRMMDYLVIYFLFIISSLYVGYNAKGEIISAISILFSISLIIFAIFSFILHMLLKNKFLSRSRIVYFSKIEIYLDKLINGMSEISNGQLVNGFFLTIIYWLLRLTMGYIILNLLNIDLDILDVIFISLTVQLVGMLPINTFAGFGTFEAAGVILLNQYGFSTLEAAAAFLKFHILTLMPMIFYGIGCWMIIQLKYRHRYSYSSKLLNK